jgi:AhpD family alkylhydroperoxidase
MNPHELHVIQALEKANATEHLTDREKHLIGLAVTITGGCTYCTGGRTEKAFESGISRETFSALTDLVAAVNAGVVVRTVLQGLEGLECDGPECAS